MPSSVASGTTLSTSTWPSSASTVSTPAMKAGKNESAVSTEASRRRTRPSAKLRRIDRDRALGRGRQPISLAVARIRSRVSGATPGRLLKTKDTRVLLTPTRRATSAMVGRRSAMSPQFAFKPV